MILLEINLLGWQQRINSTETDPDGTVQSSEMNQFFSSLFMEGEICMPSVVPSGSVCIWDPVDEADFRRKV